MILILKRYLRLGEAKQGRGNGGAVQSAER
jgi:hypothetical protein